jgi:hypothetical protein
MHERDPERVSVNGTPQRLNLAHVGSVAKPRPAIAVSRADRRYTTVGCRFERQTPRSIVDTILRRYLSLDAKWRNRFALPYNKLRNTRNIPSYHNSPQGQIEPDC